MKLKPNQKRSQNQSAHKAPKKLSNFEQINLNAAGVDIGSGEHWVSVPPDRDPQSVRRFTCFTPDLQALADWRYSVRCRDSSDGINRGVLDSFISNLGNSWL